MPFVFCCDLMVGLFWLEVISQLEYLSLLVSDYQTLSIHCACCDCTRMYVIDLFSFLSLKVNNFYRILFTWLRADQVILRSMKDVLALSQDNIFCSTFVLINRILLNKVYDVGWLQICFSDDFGIINCSFGQLFGINGQRIVPEVIIFFRFWELKFDKWACLIKSDEFVLVLKESPGFD